jgi:hypothetical protein
MSRKHVDLLFILACATVAALVYSGAVRGGFVYDDARQIVRNDLILQPGNLGRALTSDVWAFKGAGAEGVWSNYWRPVFILWLVANRVAFGLDPTGWHVANLALHAAVTALSYLVLRRLGLAPPVAAGVSLVFAVHPAHVESVAWISGSPDLLYALALLASLWCVLALIERPKALSWVGALVSFALAAGAKESALVYPPIVFVTAYVLGTLDVGRAVRLRRAMFVALPFVAIAVA